MGSKQECTVRNLAMKPCLIGMLVLNFLVVLEGIITVADIAALDEHLAAFPYRDLGLWAPNGGCLATHSFLNQTLFRIFTFVSNEFIIIKTSNKLFSIHWLYSAGQPFFFRSY